MPTDLVARLHAYLRSRGVSIIQLPSDMSTSLLAADALGTSVAAIAKSLLFFADSEPVLVIAPGDSRVNEAVLAKVLAAGQVRLAKPREVQEITGYPVGGVPPLQHASEFPVLLDARLLGHETIYAAAGTSNSIFPVSPSILLGLTGARLVDVCVSGSNV